MKVSILQVDRCKPILGAGCIWSCACASASWTGACAGPGSRLADPGLVEDHRLSWVRWSKGCKTPASSRMEGPARRTAISLCKTGAFWAATEVSRTQLNLRGRLVNWIVQPSRIAHVSQRDRLEQRKPRFQTPCSGSNGNNRCTCGGAAKGSRAGWSPSSHNSWVPEGTG